MEGQLMKIENAIYRNSEGIEELIELIDVANRSDYETVKKNLYCSFKNCSSRIEFVPQGKKIAHFKTWPRDNHSDECVNFFEREKREASSSKSRNSSAKLTESHVRDILKSMVKRVNETKEEKDLRLQRQREKAKNKNTIVDDSQNVIKSNVARPSTSNDAEYQAEGTRAPSIRRRYSPEDITENDIESANGITGDIVKIELFEKRAIISLKKNQGNLNIYLEEDFYSDATLNINTTLAALSNILQKGNPLKLYCVGDVKKRGDEICVVVSNQKNITIFGYSMESFVAGFYKS